MNKDVEVFGAYIKKLRESRCMTLAILERLSDLTSGYISNVENGNTMIPSPKRIRKLSMGLGVSHISMMIKAGHINEEDVLTFIKTTELTTMSGH